MKSFYLIFLSFVTILHFSCLKAYSSSIIATTTEISSTNDYSKNTESETESTETTNVSDQENTISTDISESQASTNSIKTSQESSTPEESGQTETLESINSTDITTKDAVSKVTTDKSISEQGKVINDVIAYIIILGICVILIGIAFFTSRFEEPPVTIGTVPPKNVSLGSVFKKVGMEKRGFLNNVKFDNAI